MVARSRRRGRLSGTRLSEQGAEQSLSVSAHAGVCVRTAAAAFVGEARAAFPRSKLWSIALAVPTPAEPSGMVRSAVMQPSKRHPDAVCQAGSSRGRLPEPADIVSFRRSRTRSSGLAWGGATSCSRRTHRTTDTRRTASFPPWRARKRGR
jgi:hypothetical protein